MTQREQLDALCMRMIDHDKGDPARIQHFLKVASLAALIGRCEGADSHTLFILEAIGYIHDIGIRIAKEKYGYQTWQLQQELGPEPARAMLEDLDFTEPDIERICWLIAHHHTFTDIEGLDYQILVEADFLVNLYERGVEKAAIENTLRDIFRTGTGKQICESMLLSDMDI